MKPDGHKVVLAVSSGYRESTASWSGLLRELMLLVAERKFRRLNSPELLPAVAAGQQYHDGLIRGGQNQEAAA